MEKWVQRWDLGIVHFSLKPTLNETEMGYSVIWGLQIKREQIWLWDRTIFSLSYINHKITGQPWGLLLMRKWESSSAFLRGCETLWCGSLDSRAKKSLSKRNSDPLDPGKVIINQTESCALKTSISIIKRWLSTNDFFLSLVVHHLSLTYLEWL